jgi:hypothetical protein
MQSRCRILAGLVVLTSFLVTSIMPAANMDAMVPPDAEVVMKLDVKQVLDSALIKKYALDPIKGFLRSPEAQQFTQATGLDPLKDLDAVTITVAGTKNPKFLVVVRGRFDADKINTAMKAQATKDPTLKSSKEGKLTVWEGKKDQNTLYTTVASPGSLAMSTDKTYLVKSVEDEGRSKPGAELQTAANKVPGKESFWIAAIVTPEMKKQMESNPQAKKYANTVKSLTGGLLVTDAILFNFQIHTTDPKIANELKMTIDGFKPLLQLMAAQGGNEMVGPLVKEVLDGLKVNTQETTVSVDLKISEELIEKIRKAAPNQ